MLHLLVNTLATRLLFNTFAIPPQRATHSLVRGSPGKTIHCSNIFKPDLPFQRNNYATNLPGQM